MNLALDLHIARNKQAYYVGSMQQHQPLIDLDINIMLKCTQSAVKVALVYPYPKSIVCMYLAHDKFEKSLSGLWTIKHQTRLLRDLHIR